MRAADVLLGDACAAVRDRHGARASAIAQGVFERWPGARLVVIECGMPGCRRSFGASTRDYRALRKQTPWLRRLPSEYARDHIRLTTQPIERPRDPRALWPSLEDVGAQEMLMFASDDPIGTSISRRSSGRRPDGGRRSGTATPALRARRAPGALLRCRVTTATSSAPPPTCRPAAGASSPVGGRTIGVFNVAGRFYALHNGCPHTGGPLCEGRVGGTTLPDRDRAFASGREGQILRCAWHGWEFDIATGRALADPAVRARTYDVSVEDGDILVRL
jgi:nitrite reductase/ring-hydroxylating ferredoxin subunit